MKKNLKSFAAFCLLAAVALTHASCGIFGVEMTDQASIDKYLRKGIEKHVDKDARITYIRLGDTGDFVKSLGTVSMDAFDPNEGDKLKSYVFDVGNNQPANIRDAIAGGKLNKVSIELARKLEDFDFSKIASNVNAGVKMIEEGGYAYDGIASYIMNVDPKTGEVKHTFSLESKMGTEMGTQNGRAALVTNYIKTDFYVDENGEVQVEE